MRGAVAPGCAARRVEQVGPAEAVRMPGGVPAERQPQGRSASRAGSCAGLPVLLALCLAVLLAPSSALSAPAPTIRSETSPDVKLLPPLRGMYHAAYPDFVGSEDKVSAARIRSFERLAGKRLAWVYFSDNWMGRIRIPARNVRIIHQAGRVPFVRLMARSTWRPGGPDPLYTMQRILDGGFDAELTAWFEDARDAGVPLLVEFGTEVDGDWFPWNGRWNGGEGDDRVRRS